MMPKEHLTELVLAVCPIMAGIITFLIGYDSKIEMASRHPMAE